MNQLEYQQAFHPGPFAQQPGSHLSQQAYSQGHTFATPQQQATAPPHAQAFASAHYPGHAASNGPHVARSQPQFHDGMQQQHPPHTVNGKWRGPILSHFSPTPYLFLRCHLSLVLETCRVRRRDLQMADTTMQQPSRIRTPLRLSHSRSLPQPRPHHLFSSSQS